MPGLQTKPDNTFPSILGIIFYKQKSYKYMDRKLGKLLDIFYDDKHSWLQWVFHFEKDFLCFSEHDPDLQNLECVSPIS